MATTEFEYPPLWDTTDPRPYLMKVAERYLVWDGSTEAHLAWSRLVLLAFAGNDTGVIEALKEMHHLDPAQYERWVTVIKQMIARRKLGAMEALLHFKPDYFKNYIYNFGLCFLPAREGWSEGLKMLLQAAHTFDAKNILDVAIKSYNFACVEELCAELKRRLAPLTLNQAWDALCCATGMSLKILQPLVDLLPPLSDYHIAKLLMDTYHARGECALFLLGRMTNKDDVLLVTTRAFVRAVERENAGLVEALLTLEIDFASDFASWYPPSRPKGPYWALGLALEHVRFGRPCGLACAYKIFADPRIDLDHPEIAAMIAAESKDGRPRFAEHVPDFIACIRRKRALGPDIQ